MIKLNTYKLHYKSIPEGKDKTYVEVIVFLLFISIGLYSIILI